MQRPQFGQRGITVNGEAVNIAASVGRSVRQPTQRLGGEPVGALKITGILFIAFIFLAWLEALLSGTSLITPISQTLLWSLRGVGLVVGIGAAVVVVFGVAEGSLLRRGATLLFLLLTGVVASTLRFSSTRGCCRKSPRMPSRSDLNIFPRYTKYGTGNG